MVNSPTASRRPVVVLLDMYEWAEDYPASNPLGNVTGWFERYLPAPEKITLRTVGVNDDMVGAISDADAVIMSGSPRDAWTDDAVNSAGLEVVQHCVDSKKPFLGVCYGHQLLGRALKANVGRQPTGYELGNVDVRLTDDGRSCPLFDGMPDVLPVIESHQDAVLELPKDARLLAAGACAVQAFDFREHMLGVQFHPEMDPSVLQFVWGESRRAKWRPLLDFDLDARLAGLKPTPQATRIFQNFIEHYVL